MPTGRPLKFKTPKELEDAGMAYLTQCEQARQPLTITGLALALGTTRQTLLEYEGEVEGREKSEGFADAVKRLKTYIENYAEQALFINKNAAGPIFALKNFGWRDRQEVDQNTNVHFTGLEKLTDDQLDAVIQKIQASISQSPAGKTESNRKRPAQVRQPAPETAGSQPQPPQA